VGRKASVSQAESWIERRPCLNAPETWACVVHCQLLPSATVKAQPPRDIIKATKGGCPTGQLTQVDGSAST